MLPTRLRLSEPSARRSPRNTTILAAMQRRKTGTTPIDPDLAQVIEAWHTLPPDTRTAILAIVEAAQGR
jgi:hypothetical protein